MTRIDGFQHEQLNPAIAAVLADDSGEYPIVVVNTNQPHRAALDAVRAIKLHAVCGLLGMVQLFEPLRRAPVEPIIVVTAALATALSGTAIALNAATPGQQQQAPQVYIADERKPLVRVARPWSSPGQRAHTANERRPTPTRSPRPQPSPQPTATPRAHPTPIPTPVPSYVFLTPLPTP